MIPTETVYGLVARIDREDALKKIFQVKGRPSDNPLILHISSLEMLKSIIDGPISYEYSILIDQYWPGPLTLIFKCKNTVSKTVRGTIQDTVAVRMPKDTRLRNLIDKIGVPLAAPSSNTSGKPSPTSIQHVIEDLGEKVNIYIDDGPCSIGLESTVLLVNNEDALLLRPGGINLEDLEKTLNRKLEVKSKVKKGEKPISPGQKYKHYAPSVPVYLFKGELWKENMTKQMNTLQNRRIGLMAPTDCELKYLFPSFYDLGRNKKEFCKNIFSGLRHLDKTADIIFVREFTTDNKGLAIMDKIEKAASFVVE